MRSVFLIRLALFITGKCKERTICILTQHIPHIYAKINHSLLKCTKRAVFELKSLYKVEFLQKNQRKTLKKG